MIMSGCSKVFSILEILSTFLFCLFQFSIIATNAQEQQFIGAHLNTISYPIFVSLESSVSGQHVSDSGRPVKKAPFSFFPVVPLLLLFLQHVNFSAPPGNGEIS